MLALAAPKFQAASSDAPSAPSNIGPRPSVLNADALALPFPDASFHAATVSFGLRNVADLDRALAELARVLRPGGELGVLEFTVPVWQPLRGLYLFYFQHLLPRVGRLLSHDPTAYTYLPSSVLDFPQRAGVLRPPGGGRLRVRDLHPSLGRHSRPLPWKEEDAMTQLLEAKTVSAEIRAEVAAGALEVQARAGRPPGLAAVLVGDDPASRVYVGSKTRACAEVGLAGWSHLLPAATSAAELLALLDQLNADPRVDGILVQLPLPATLPAREILDRVDPAKDVDGFHPVSVGRLWLDQPGFVPCTPAGILESLRRHGIPSPASTRSSSAAARSSASRWRACSCARTAR